MPALVVTTLNASYTHSSLALRYLKANLGPHTEDAVIREFIISARPIDIVEELLQDDPKIIAFGVYVWNVVQTHLPMTGSKVKLPGASSGKISSRVCSYCRGSA